MLETPVLTNVLHHFYSQNLANWIKYRRTYEGGVQFVRHYLKQFSSRESIEDFHLRREISYCPAFAKAAINDVKNSIFQRFIDITREGGSKSYNDSILGRNGGVDNVGNSMDSFLGRRILPELLSMGRVVIYVDMPELLGPTISDKGNNHPYLYYYQTESLKSWAYDVKRPDRLLSVLLEDYEYVIDEKTGLTSTLMARYRHLWINENGYVSAQYYNDKGGLYGETMELALTEIPVVILELSHSLLEDVADYQIALLNLESSDLFYALRSNFPFYTEQFNPRAESPYLKPSGSQIEIIHKDRVLDTVSNESDHQRTVIEGLTQEVVVGTAAGRRYPMGLERPGFINPSAEPLRVSMEKAEQIKRDIRHLINLSIQSLEPRRASAESKVADNQSLENGLSYIGLELEFAERKIAKFWSIYEGVSDTTTINYPLNYDLKNDKERRDEAEYYQKLTSKIASKTFRKEVTKRIVDLTIGNHVSYIVLENIKKEIDNSEVIVSDPDIIEIDIKNGLVSAELASKIRGYPLGEVEVAAKEHAEKLARIAISQSKGIAAAGARGIGELSGDPQSGEKEKVLAEDTTYDSEPKNKIRGEGIKNLNRE